MFSKDLKTVKIIDMGLSKQSLQASTRTCTAKEGTIRYQAPEQLNSLLTFGIDIW